MNKKICVIVNSSSNVNKLNNFLSHEKKNRMQKQARYVALKIQARSGLRPTHNCGGVKPVNMISNLPADNWLYNNNICIVISVANLIPLAEALVFSATFNYISVSFISGGNRETQLKSLKYLVNLDSVGYKWW